MLSGTHGIAYSVGMEPNPIRTAASLAIAFSLCACGHDEPNRRHDTATRQAPTPNEHPSAGPVARMLVLEDTRDDAPRASYVAVSLPEDAAAPPSLGAPWTHPSLPRGESPGAFRTVCAASGGRFARVERVGDRYALVVRRLDQGTEQSSLDLGTSEPHALMLLEHGALVGAVTKVTYADFAARAVTTLVEREDAGRKAYDVFARAGDRVVAIDDVVRPIYADLFALEGHAAPRRVADWSLPPLINGMYRHAVLVPRGEGRHTLYVVAPYGILDGNGQEVAAIPIEGTRLGVTDQDVLNSGGRRPWVIEEHVSRRAGGEARLLAGTELTLFAGLAFAEEKILLAAGARGLFVLPADFAGDRTPQVITALGAVHDVTTAFGRVFALVSGEGDTHALVELAHREGAFASIARTPLPARYVRFVD